MPFISYLPGRIRTIHKVVPTKRIHILGLMFLSFIELTYSNGVVHPFQQCPVKVVVVVLVPSTKSAFKVTWESWGELREKGEKKGLGNVKVCIMQRMCANTVDTCWRIWKIVGMTADKAHVFHFNPHAWTKSCSTSFKRQLGEIKRRINRRALISEKTN